MSKTSGTPSPASAAKPNTAPGSTASPSTPPSFTAASANRAKPSRKWQTPPPASNRIWKIASVSPNSAPPSPSSPEQDRLVISLLLEGLSYREIAEITGLTVNYVGVKLSRIKQAIEHRLSEVTHGAI